MTLAVDATAKPVGLVPMESAVSRVAQVRAAEQEAQRRGIDPQLLVPYHCQVLKEDPLRIYRSAGTSLHPPLEIPAPLVMMWPGYVELEARETRRVTRRVLFARDGFSCQYCSYIATPRGAFKVLTVDHVKPAHLFESRHQSTNWENVTTACIPCNRQKGGKLPAEAHMYPRTTPKEPHFIQLRFAGRLNDQQRDYVAEYFKIREESIIF